MLLFKDVQIGSSLTKSLLKSRSFVHRRGEDGNDNRRESVGGGGLVGCGAV